MFVCIGTCKVVVVPPSTNVNVPLGAVVLKLLLLTVVPKGYSLCHEGTNVKYIKSRYMPEAPRQAIHLLLCLMKMLQ